jgi:excinuclease ABC subunit A
VISLHHTHLMASDIDATIAFWREGFGARVVHDTVFAVADHLIDMGPGLGSRAGRVVLEGAPARLLTASGSVTGACLRRNLAATSAAVPA